MQCYCCFHVTISTIILLFSPALWSFLYFPWSPCSFVQETRNRNHAIFNFSLGFRKTYVAFVLLSRSRQNRKIDWIVTTWLWLIKHSRRYSECSDVPHSPHCLLLLTCQWLWVTPDTGLLVSRLLGPCCIIITHDRQTSNKWTSLHLIHWNFVAMNS